jgi:hypothetical protein
MRYPCPEPADIDDVQALNRAFLERLNAATGRRPAAGAAEVPFLLYTLDAPDEGLWDRLFDARIDLVDVSASTPDDWATLVSSTLGFLWHLSRRDLHAVRLFSGYPNDWCERLAARPLIQLVNDGLAAGIRPALRFDAADPAWRALASSRRSRRARHSDVMRALQSLLVASEKQAPFATAACRLRPVAKGVADGG